jgi:hypothetical protein
VSATVDVASGVAPLAVNFTLTAEDDDGTIAEYAWDFEGDGIYDGTSATNPSPLPNTYSTANLYNAKFRVTDNEGSWDVDTVAVNVTGPAANLPPVAILIASPMTGSAPLDVIFDASQSFDTDGNIVSYEWDLDNDGVFNEAGEEAASEGFDYVQVTYGYSNYFTATVRLYDDGGAQATATAGATVTGWGVQMLDTANNSGATPSLKIINGRPAISFCISDGLSSSLHYVRARDSRGSSWGTPVTVDDDGNVGEDNSLATVNGHPAIAYFDSGNMDLKFVRANDVNGSLWGTPVTLDSADAVGGFPSLGVVNGCPAISYLDQDSQHLKFIRANDADGDSWGAPIVADDSSWGVGWASNLVIVNGNPAIAYWDYALADAKYVRANDVNGASWNTPITIASAGSIGFRTSIAIVNGYPAISYSDYDNNAIKYIKASDVNGDNWDTPVTINSTDYCYSISLAVIGGYPAISYSPGGHTLSYILATNTDGSTWGAPITLDAVDVGGTSLMSLGGYPAIAYSDASNNRLRFARLY